MITSIDFKKIKSITIVDNFITQKEHDDLVANINVDESYYYEIPDKYRFISKRLKIEYKKLIIKKSYYGTVNVPDKIYESDKILLILKEPCNFRFEKDDFYSDIKVQPRSLIIIRDNAKYWTYYTQMSNREKIIMTYSN